MIPTIKQIFQSIPKRFLQERAAEMDTVFHFEISGEEAANYSIIINKGNCSLFEGLMGEPKCVVKTKDRTYIDIETGKANPQMALMMGKVKVSNIAEMMAFSKVFRRFSTEQTSDSEISDKSHTSSRKPQKGPLVGIRVLDLSRLLPGPLATMLMADMGAEVIKIEDINSPDYIRSFPPFIGSESAYYLALNRSKRSVMFNFNSTEGKKIFSELVESADVVVEQYRPGVLDRMGMGYEAAKKIKKDIIYVSITGYGQSGPYAQNAGHDLNYIGYAGVLDTNGNVQSPVIPGAQLADVAGGSYMAMNACLAAVLHRYRTGEGQHVDVAMTDCVMPLISMFAASQWATGNEIKRGDFQLSGGIANYNVYKCADGKFVALGSLEPKFWNSFCDLAQKPEWKNRILDSGVKMQELIASVSSLFLTLNRNEWLDKAKSYDACLTPVLTIDELEHDEQLKHREMIVEQKLPEGNTIKSIGVPLKFSGSPAKPSWNPPSAGEDTYAVLTELGYKGEVINELAAKGAVKLS